jgi:hypothetical protein
VGIDLSSMDVDVKIKPPLPSIPDITVAKVGSVGPVTVAGIPDEFTFHMDITKLPKIQIGLDPLEIKPLELSLRLKELPSIRGHLPADFSVGLSLLGLELMSLRLCGEAQIITEPYHPNPCEICGSTRHTDDAHDVD